MTSEVLFKLIIELTVAVSHYLWPIVTLIIVLIFRTPIKELLGRIRKGKLFGQELELDSAVSEFRITVQQAEKEIPQLPETKEVKGLLKEATEYLEPKEFISGETNQTDLETNQILDDSRNDPEVAIIRLSAILEKEARAILGSLGHLPPRSKITVRQALQKLEAQGLLPKHTISSLTMFWDLRNKIIHGEGAVDKKDILSVLDTGIVLLKTLRAIPREINIVYKIVDVFEDPECIKTREDVKGLILETISPGGGIKSFRIYPTTRPSYYKLGKRVIWEWNLSKTWGHSWYIDPDTGEKKSAWVEAGEFVSRHMDEI